MQGPPPPPPGGASPPPNRFVRKQHASPSPSSSPANCSLDATHRPPPSHSLGDSSENQGGKDAPHNNAFSYSSSSPHHAGEGSRRNSSPSYEGAGARLSFAEGEGTPSESHSGRKMDNAEFSTTSPASSSSVGRKLRALRRAGGFSELASVPERLQQWFDGCYSPRYQTTSTLSLVAGSGADHHQQQQQQEFDPAIRAASLALHASLASFSIRHCFDSPLFDAAGGDSAPREQQDSHLSTVSGASSGLGVDHGAKALYDKWTSSFEECLTDFVSSVLKLTDEEFAATLEIDKKEEEGSGEVNFLAACSASYSATPPSLTSYVGGISPRRPVSQSGALSSNFDFRTAIAPLAAALSAHLSVALSNRAGNIVNGNNNNNNNGGSSNKLGGTPQHRPIPSHYHQPFGAPPPLPLDSGLLSTVNPSHLNNNNHVVQLEQEEQQQQRSEKEHFYRWSEAIEFPAFVAQLRGTRALLAKIFGGSAVGEVVGLSHETLTAVRSFVQKEGGGGENEVRRLFGNAQEITDPSTRAAAHKLSKSLAKEFFSRSASIESSKKEELSFFFLTPLSHFVKDASASARQTHRRRAALVPLMALWCPLGMDEDIWPTIQSLLSASGAPLSSHASNSSDTAPPLTLKITLDKKRLKELTLFRIRLSAAGRKAALMASSVSAADSHIGAGASPAVLSSPQYLLRPTASAAGSVAVAVEKTAADSSLSAVANDDSAPTAGLTAAGTATTATKGGGSVSSGALDASEDLERDWTRFISVFAEGLDSATFDKFVSYMYNVVLPQVVARDSRELVRLAFGGSNPVGSHSGNTSGNSSGTNLAAAFCASISSPLASTTGLANTKSGSASSSTTSHLPPAGSVQSAINAAARTVKRVFWLSFQQLDTLRRDAIPLGLVLDLISAAAEEIVAAKNSADAAGGSGGGGGGATGLAEIISGAEARLQEDSISRRATNQNDPIVSSCDTSPFSYRGEVSLFPPQLAVDLSTISCTSVARLASYLKFTDRDRAKLLIRIRNEQKALEREANLQGLLTDVTRRDDAAKSASSNNNARNIGGVGGSQASTNLSPSTTSTSALLSASTMIGGVEETLPVSLYKFVHIVKDLVFDPLYSASHPVVSTGTTPSPSASSLSSLSFGDRSGSRHMYWSELVAFVEVLMVISNLPRFRQQLKKRS